MDKNGASRSMPSEDRSPVARYPDDITIVVKTFERPECLRALVSSIRLFYPEIPIIIVDDGRQPLDPATFDETCRYIHTEFDIGLSEGRNRGVALVDTEFTMIVDDDLVFTSDSKLERLRAPLVDVGFSMAGCRMMNFGTDEVIYHGRINTNGRIIELQNEVCNGHQHGYPIFEYCLNVFMARTDFLRDNPWDPELKLAEHWDFFYCIKKADSGLLTVVPDVSFDHYPVYDEAYREFRWRGAEYMGKALAKHGFDDVDRQASHREKVLLQRQKKPKPRHKLLRKLGLRK